MRRSPRRSCIGCRAVREKKELVRIAHTPDDRYVLDPTGKAAGRGAYLCPSAACLAQALKRRSFDRAFRQAVPQEAAASLAAGIEEWLRARAPAAGARDGDQGAR